jgi:transglutaminase-like putative cysteine protease
VIRYGTLALVLVAAMRATAVRHPNAMAFELAVIAAAYTGAFAAHRDGVIARPLWLSDWAWQEGIDPAHVLLAIGGIAVVTLAVLLIAERKDGLSFSSLIALAALALLAVLSLNVVGLPSPTAANDLGLNNPPEDGDPPQNQPPPRPDGGRGPQPNEGDGGRRPENGDGDGGQQPSGGDGGGSNQTMLDGGVDGGGSGWMLDGGGGQSNAMLDGSMGQRDGGGGSGQQQQQRDGGQGQGQQQQPPRNQQDIDRNEDQLPTNSPAPMAVVILDDDYEPPAGAFYFRQEAWSEFNGHRLVLSRKDGVDLDIYRQFPTERTRMRFVPTGQGRTKVRAQVAMLVEHSGPFALEAPVSLRPMANPNPDRFTRAYRFESQAQTLDYRRLLGRTVGDPTWTEEVRAHYLVVPPDPRYAELAQEIVNTLPANRREDPFARALAIKLWLDHELIYSTRHRHAGVDDPTADFLFGNRTGYCVHFAHSAVYLWRAMGIPSRIGTGYHSPAENRQGGSAILIRGGDAHAWPEIYFDKLGWIVLDIAAERNLDPPGQPVDDDLQRILGEMARDEEPEPEPPPQAEKPYPHYGRDLGYGALSLLIAILLFLYGVKVWRRLVPIFAGAKTAPRVAYRKALDLLGEAGISRDFGETREAFAARVGSFAPSFQRLTEMHVAARLREPPPGTPRPEFSPDVVRESLRAVSREIPKGTKWWRRILGKIHPTSFLESR